MKPGDTIEFRLPRSADFRTGRIEGFITYQGTLMPVVTDHRDREYPVHPANITNTEPTEL